MMLTDSGPVASKHEPWEKWSSHKHAAHLAIQGPCKTSQYRIGKSNRARGGRGGGVRPKSNNVTYQNAQAFDAWWRRVGVVSSIAAP